MNKTLKILKTELLAAKKVREAYKKLVAEYARYARMVELVDTPDFLESS